MCGWSCLVVISKGMNYFGHGFFAGDEKLRGCQLSDEFLLRFVRGKNCDSKSAFETVWPSNYLKIWNLNEICKYCDKKFQLKNYAHIRRDKYRHLFAKLVSFCLHYLQIRTCNFSVTNWLSNLSSYHPSTVRHVFDSGMIRVLKHRDDFGRPVFVMVCINCLFA